MIVAARSSSECAASDRIASEPVATPTAPLASVKAPDAAIDDNATLCLMSCMSGARCRRRSGGRPSRQLERREPMSINAVGEFGTKSRTFLAWVEQSFALHHSVNGPLGELVQMHT